MPHGDQTLGKGDKNAYFEHLGYNSSPMAYRVKLRGRDKQGWCKQILFQ